jgi:alkaline phosphatase D
LILTLTTYDNCTKLCTIEDINPTYDSYAFSNRHYHVFKFKGLEQYQKYIFNCDGHIGDIIFPHNKLQTKVVAFGDWSISPEGDRTKEYVSQHSYDAVIQLGDLAYDLHFENGDVGNRFMTWSTPVTEKMPFMAVPGNHEGNDNFNNFINRYTLPNKKILNNMYYSFDINNVHFVAVNTEYALKGCDQKMKEWLIKDLQETNARFIIAYMHRPMYCSFDDERCISETATLRSCIEDILKDRVDLVLAGHLHNYERSLPVYNNQVDSSGVRDNTYINPKYPTYLICGSGGNSIGQTPNCTII